MTDLHSFLNRVKAKVSDGDTYDDDIPSSNDSPMRRTMTDTTKLETTIAQALHDNAPQGLVDFLDAYDIVADVWFMNYANILASHLTRAGFVSVEDALDTFQNIDAEPK